MERAPPATLVPWIDGFTKAGSAAAPNAASFWLAD
jgi:hypothetical protein